MAKPTSARAAYRQLTLASLWIKGRAHMRPVFLLVTGKPGCPTLAQLRWHRAKRDQDAY